MSEPAPPPAAAQASRHMPRRVLLAAFGLFVVWGLYQAVRPVPDQLQGMVDADQVNAATRVLSRVDRLLVREGDLVQAGQALAVLSSPEVDARQAQAEAALTSARALQARADSGERRQDIASLDAAWKAAQAQAALAELTARRAENLFKEGVIPQQRRDDADAARSAAGEAAEAAHQQYLKALAGARDEDKRMAASQVASAQATVRETDALAEETHLIAPITGEVDKRFASAGEIVMPGVPVFTLIDLNDLWVAVNIREDEFRGVKMGRIIKGAVPALDLKEVPFQIDYISPQGDFATWRSTRQSRGYDVKSFEVRARPVHTVAGLRPGMSVLFPWPQG